MRLATAAVAMSFSGGDVLSAVRLVTTAIPAKFAMHINARSWRYVVKTISRSQSHVLPIAWRNGPLARDCGATTLSDLDGCTPRSTSTVDTSLDDFVEVVELPISMVWRMISSFALLLGCMEGACVEGWNVIACQFLTMRVKARRVTESFARENGPS
jgi:hypothetical protein